MKISDMATFLEALRDWRVLCAEAKSNENRIDELPEASRIIYSWVSECLQETTTQKKPQEAYYPSIWKYGDVLTLKTAAFPDYPAAPLYVGQDLSCVITEGPPDQAHLSQLVVALAKNNVHIIVSVGEPEEGPPGAKQRKFMDYMQNSVSYQQWFKEVANRDIPILPFNTRFRFFKETCYDEQGRPYFFYGVNIPTFPDHGVPEFSLADIQILAHLLSISKKCFHCHAGLNRSASLIFMELLLRRQDFSEKGIKDIIRDIQTVKPGAFSDWHQIIAALGIAGEIHHYFPSLFQHAQTTALDEDEDEKLLFQALDQIDGNESQAPTILPPSRVEPYVAVGLPPSRGEPYVAVGLPPSKPESLPPVATVGSPQNFFRMYDGLRVADSLTPEEIEQMFAALIP